MPHFIDTPSGKVEAYIMWLNMLNGMPPAGKAFSDDFTAHVCLFEYAGHKGMLRTVTDHYVYVWFGPASDMYLKVAANVDDYLCFYKGEGVLEAFDAHMAKRWKTTKAGLDGWLNNQFYMDPVARTVTMTSEVRISEIMAEHLPDELGASSFPPTPYHPNLRSLKKGDGTMPKVDAQRSRRLCAQLIHEVVMTYYHAQEPVFLAARYQAEQSMSPLALECLLYTLRYLYGQRHCGPTLGGDGSELEPARRFLAASHADAGHAEAGPSTGGHTQDVGTTTVQVASGQHHATTLATTDAETYEVSRAVASTQALRSFLTEVGYPQELPSPIYCDNDGTVLKAASARSDKRSLYMRRRVEFCLESQAQGHTLVTEIASADNRADLLTKALKTEVFQKLRGVLMNVARSNANLRSHLFTLSH